jgi:hypothetical protein
MSPIRDPQPHPSPRRRPLLLRIRITRAAFALTVGLFLLLTVVQLGRAGRIADWKATELQLLNLDVAPAPLNARFFDPVGRSVFTVSDTLASGTARFFQPEQQGLDPGFTGTVRIDTEQLVVGAVLHRAFPAAGMAGNDVFPMVQDNITATVYHAAWVERMSPEGQFTSQILVANLGSAPAEVQVSLSDSSSTPVWQDKLDIPVNGSIELDLAGIVQLTAGFGGSAQLQATQPIHIDIVRSNESQWAIYAAQPEGSAQLVAPLVAGLIPGAATPTIHLLNPQISATGLVTVCAVLDGSCSHHPLPPGASLAVLPEADHPDTYLIEGSVPIMATICTDSPAGSSAYAAVPVNQAATHLAAPLLLGNHDDWLTTWWVYNPTSSPATISIHYVSASGESWTLPSIEVGPTAIRPLEPWLEASIYAGWIQADRPVLGLIEGHHPQEPDGRFTYWATPFSPSAWRQFLPLLFR